MLLQMGMNRLLDYSPDVPVLILLVVIWLYLLMFGGCLVMTLLPSRATLGMMLLGLRLESEYGESDSTGCLLYNLLRSAPVLGMVAELTVCERASGMTARRRGHARQTGNRDVSYTDARQNGGGGYSEASDASHSGTVTGSSVVFPPQGSRMRLSCVSGTMKGKSVVLHDGMTIGRGVREPNLLTPSEDLTVSTKHCVFRFENGEWTLEDCSTNGTKINGRKVNRARTGTLKPGTRIEVGSQRFILENKP